VTNKKSHLARAKKLNLGMGSTRARGYLKNRRPSIWLAYCGVSNQPLTGVIETLFVTNYNKKT
jgi:hypothetical protein